MTGDTFPTEALGMPMYDAGDPEQVEKANQADELRRTQEHDMILTVLNSYEGRAVFSILFRHAGLESISFAGEFPLTMAYNEGRRSIGKDMRDLFFTVAPERYSMVRNEMIERERTYARSAGLLNIVEDENE